MKITGALSAVAILAITEAFSPIGRANTPPKSSINAHIDTRHTILPQEIGVWSTTPPKGYVPPHTEHIDTRHTILPQELGIWSTAPPAGYVPPHAEHIDTRKKILDQESKGIWPTSPPPGWVCPKPEGCSGEDIREAWESYAPYHHDGKVGSVGFVGCPGGGDWCYGSKGPASSLKPVVSSSNAKNVAAVLAGLGSSSAASASKESAAGPPKRYGIGSWKNSDSSNEGAPTDSFDSLGDTSWAIELDNVSPTTTKLRRPIVAGNWKLNPSSKAEAITLLKLLASNFLNNRNTIQSYDTPETVIFPPLPYLADAVQILEGTGIQVGAQDVGPNEKGAFTGEIAPSMLVSAGCSYVLLGHSERRTLFGETDEAINAKVLKSLEQPGLKVILCVGETLQEYQSGMLESVVNTQITKGLEGVEASMLLNDRVIIAYEPCWAIGTGLVATPAQAQHAHVAIRSTLANMYGADSGVSESVRIQYGGSVTPDSAEELISEMDVDGALVGGASLNADSFTRIFDGATSATAKKKGTVSGRINQPFELTATLALATTNALGESPVWSVKDQCLYWVSATEGEVWRWNLIDQPHRRLLNTAVGCVGLLRSSTPGSVIIAAESAILTTSMITPGGNPHNPMPDFATGPTVLCNRPDHMSTTRPNDGRVDRFGNFVVGMYNQYHRTGATAGENNAGLFRLNSNTLQWEEILDYRFRVSNCISFSPDCRTMYFGDTPTRAVYAFDYSPNGPLTNRRLVWTMPPDLPGGPDGAQVDSNGKLWIAVTGANRVVQLDPNTGQIEMIVHLDANPTSLTFGGPGLDELFITTRAPNGGGLYRVRMPFGVKGLPEPEFRLGTPYV